MSQKDCSSWFWSFLSFFTSSFTGSIKPFIMTIVFLIYIKYCCIRTNCIRTDSTSTSVFHIRRNRYIFVYLLKRGLPIGIKVFILRGNLFYVLPCVILFLCFSVLLALRLLRLRKRKLILVFFVRLSICARLVSHVSASSWYLGKAAVCDCGTPWAFLLPFVSC